MSSNKSIDGLITRDAKNSASSSDSPVSRRSAKPRDPGSVTGIVKPTRSRKTAHSTNSTPSPANHHSARATKSPDPTPTTSSASTSPKPSTSDSLREPDLNLAAPLKANLDDSLGDVATREQVVADFLSPIQAFDLNEGGELTASKSTVKEIKDSAKSKSPSHDRKSRKSAKAKSKNPPSKTRRIITSVALILILGIIGVVLWAVLWGNDIIAKITGGQGNVFDLLTFVDEKYDPLKADANGRTNILAFGTSGYNMNGDEGDGVHDGAQLTDSIMLISLNQETGDVAMLSLPRDLKASPTCTRTGKINEVYWCNNMSGDDEEAGATALMTEVGNILGLDIQYYAHLNWGSLVSIVDILGGIKVTLDEDIKDYYYTEAVFEAGVEYEINGEQALGLARARHGTSGGDFSRGASQQKILIGIKNKIFEKNLSLSDLLSLASTLGDNLRTNFSLAELKTLAHLTYDFDFDSMRQISLLDPKNNIRLMTTGMVDGISYVLPAAGVGNYGAIQDYVKKQLSNDPREYETYTILVLNASDVTGLASDERTKLMSDNFINITTDNAPANEYSTGTTLYALTDQDPGVKSLLEKRYGTTAKSKDTIPATISQDYDFVIILNPSTN